MQIKLWGVRGSIPSPLTNEEYYQKIHKILNYAVRSKIKSESEIDKFIAELPDDLKYIYGGNTTCIEITSKNGNKYIIDCGSGLRLLGYDLMKGPWGTGKGICNIFFTHNHWDHIQGLPFFSPIYIPGNIFNFYSPFLHQKESLIKQQNGPFFPGLFENTLTEKNFYLLEPKNRTPLQLEDDLVVDIYPLKHPCNSYAYRFKQGNKIFVFATDAEFTGETLEENSNNNDFFSDADLLVIDSQYTLQESFLKIDWGHTSYTMAVNCGVRWNVKNLVLTHHEPAYSDEKLFEIHNSAIEHGELISNESTKIIMAREGMSFNL